METLLSWLFLLLGLGLVFVLVHFDVINMNHENRGNGFHNLNEFDD